MIIWIASYPKSGNTWVRSFLTTLLYSEFGENNFSHLNKIQQFPTRSQFKDLVDNYQDIKQISENWISSQQRINLDEKIKFFKTHHVNCKIGNNPFTNNNNTLGVIHVVRDPRNIITSLKNHYSIPTYNLAKEFLFDEKRWIGFVNNKQVIIENKILTLISSWKTHYLSWKNSSKNYLLVKYEDLINSPYQSFNVISEYVSKLTSVILEKNKIEKAINSNSFESLKNLEEGGYFKEYIHRKSNMPKFFNLGPKNDWKHLLDKEIVDEIEEKFFEEMKELKYL